MSAWHRSTLAVVLLSIALGAHDRAQSFSQLSSSDHEKCVIEGVVTSVPTGEPLRGAVVYLTAPGKYKALFRAETDAQGKFSLEDVEPGEYELEADKTGYYDPERRCDSEEIHMGDEVRLAPGQKIADVKLRLVAPAVITGTVVDPQGDPVATVGVEAVRISSHWGKQEIAREASSQTDDRGQFRIFHLEPGSYFVRVAQSGDFMRRARDGDDSSAGGRKGFLPIYYPDTTDISRASLLELTAGGELSQINLTVHSARVLRVRGKVVNGLTGDPITGGSISAELMPPSLRENGSTAGGFDEDSEFDIDDLVPGKYALSVQAWVLPERRRWAGRRQIELTDSNLDGLQIQVFPGHDLAGRIEWAGGKKMESQHLQIQLESHGVPGYWGGYAAIKTDGTFSLPDVMQGTFDLRISGLPDGYYLQSAKLGNLDVTEGLKIGGGAITEPLAVVLSPSGAQVEGMVVNSAGKPACTAAVVLIPSGDRRSNQFLYQNSEVDRNGHYAFKGVTPGDYKLFAFDHEGVVPYFDAVALSVYETQGQSVHFDAGDRRTVMLKVIVTGTNSP